MATIEQFEDIRAWQYARVLTQQVYEVTMTHPFRSDRPLCDQIRRAAVSAMSNIAEGFERGGNKEFRQFLSIAKGSAGEVRSQLYVARDVKFITDEHFIKMNDIALNVTRSIAVFQRYLQQADIRGIKYRVGEESILYDTASDINNLDNVQLLQPQTSNLKLGTFPS